MASDYLVSVRGFKGRRHFGLELNGEEVKGEGPDGNLGESRLLPLVGERVNLLSQS